MSPLDLAAGSELLHIAVDEQWEIDYWTRKFGVDEAELRRAIQATGPSVVSVAHLLTTSGSAHIGEEAAGTPGHGPK